MGMREWCFECGEPNPSIGNYCPACEAKRERHREMVKATKWTTDAFCKEAIKNGWFYYLGKNYKVTKA